MRRIIIKKCEKVDYKKIEDITRKVVREELNSHKSANKLKPSSNNLQNAISSAILDAHKKETENIKIQNDEANKAIVQKRMDAWGVSDCFDKNGHPKNIRARIKLMWKFLNAKEYTLKDADILGPTINAIVAFFFALIEWALYLFALAFTLFGFYNIIHIVISNWPSIPFDIFGYFTFLLYAAGAFLLSRVFIRTLKIDCKYNKDNHYMLNLLAVIIAIIALLISTFKRGGA